MYVLLELIFSFQDDAVKYVMMEEVDYRKATQTGYFARAFIFLRFFLSLRIRFLRHLARIFALQYKNNKNHRNSFKTSSNSKFLPAHNNTNPHSHTQSTNKRRKEKIKIKSRDHTGTSK